MAEPVIRKIVERKLSMMKFHRFLFLAIFVLCPLVLNAADSGLHSSYSDAAEQLELDFEEAGDDEFKQREALQEYASTMLALSQKYQGDLADQALVESAMAFEMSGNTRDAEKSLRAAEKRVKTWEIQILLMQAFLEVKNQEAAAKRYAESLMPAAKLSKTKKNELLPFLKALDMRREIADLEAGEKSAMPTVAPKDKSSAKSSSGGQPAPDFLARDFENGVSFSLRDYRGKVVLIDFWATWCGPCIQEMPNVIRAYQKYHDKGFEIIGISLDSDMRTLQNFLDANEIEWRQACDGKGWKGDIVQQYGVDGIPATFLVDAEGNLIASNLRGSALDRKLGEIFSE